MKEDNNIGVNHEVLVWARETIAMNRTNVTEKTNISATRLILLEESGKQPTLKEKGRTYVSPAFSAYDQNRIDLKDLSDFLGVKLSYIPKTRQL